MDFIFWEIQLISVCWKKSVPEKNQCDRQPYCRCCDVTIFAGCSSVLWIFTLITYLNFIFLSIFNPKLPKLWNVVLSKMMQNHVYLQSRFYTPIGDANFEHSTAFQNIFQTLLDVLFSLQLFNFSKIHPLCNWIW